MKTVYLLERKSVVNGDQVVAVIKNRKTAQEVVRDMNNIPKSKSCDAVYSFREIEYLG